MKPGATVEDNGYFGVVFLHGFAQLQCHPFGHVQAFVARIPVIIDLVFVLEQDWIDIKVNDVFGISALQSTSSRSSNIGIA